MILNTKDVRQKDGYSCGLAALNSVLHYHGRKMLHLLGHGVPSAVDGTDPRTLEAAARSCGLKVLSGEMHLNDLRNFIQQKLPVIVLVENHYQIVEGVHNRTVWMQCSIAGKFNESDAAFMKRWSDSHHLGAIYHQWGIVCW